MGRTMSGTAGDGWRSGERLVSKQTRNKKRVRYIGERGETAHSVQMGQQ